MAEQKFKRGDKVHIAKNLGNSMSHFESDKDAIVMYSYVERCGGTDENGGHVYCLMLLPEGYECSWYWERQLTFIEHVGEWGITEVKAEKFGRQQLQTDLRWIVKNWTVIRDNPPGPTLGELMRRIGITNPWGASGEGIKYYENAQFMLRHLGPALDTGDEEAVLKQIELVKKAIEDWRASRTAVPPHTENS